MTMSTTVSVDATAVIAAIDLTQTFLLHSRPSATKRIYLDFDGHVATGTRWNNGATITTPAFSLDANSNAFSDAEKTAIQDVWLRVMEDFAPFDVDVTTEEPPPDDLRNTGNGDTRWGIRCVIGGDGAWLGSAAGVAYLRSFNWDSDTPCFAFAGQWWKTNNNVIAGCISHEVGHSLGLSHDGYNGSEYYGGRGSGATSWGPLMGNPDTNLTQWSKGDYAGSTNTEDDLAIISTTNGFTYRPDDYGNGISDATPLPIHHQVPYTFKGLIERNTDVDVFTFTAIGSIVATITPQAVGPNLDVLAEIWDSKGVKLYDSNPAAALDASFTVTVTPGTYYLAIRGTGKGDPTTTGYTNYGSIGQYTVSITADTTSAPVGSFESVPAYRGTPLQSITLSFNKPVTGVDAPDFRLTRDGISVPLPDIAVAGSGGAFTITGFATATTPLGAYQLTISASSSGIRDASGNELAADISVQWTTIDGAAPIAAYEAIPARRITPLSSLAVTFTKPVTGVDVADFTLTRDGVAVPMTGVTVTGSDASYVLVGLADATTTLGTYRLTLRAAQSDITDILGTSLNSDATATWSVVAPTPLTAVFASLPSSRTTPLTSVGLTFSAAITGVDVTDIALTLNGNVVPLTGVCVTGSGPTYTIIMPTTATAGLGSYRLALNASQSGIGDADGNALTADAYASWTMIDATPPEASFSSVPANLLAGLPMITVHFSEAVTGVDESDFALTRDGFAVPLVGVTVSGSGTAYTLTGLEAVTTPHGRYVLRLNPNRSGIVDASANAMTRAVEVIWLVKNNYLPAAPLNVSGIAGNGRVGLSWIGVVTPGIPPTVDYVVEISSNNGLTWQIIADGVSNTPSSTIPGLVNGLAYRFRVRAVNSLGSSLPSDPSDTLIPTGNVDAGPLPGPAFGLSGKAGSGEVTLAWTAPKYGGFSPITDYVIQFSANDGATWGTFQDAVTATSSTRVTGLSNGGSYVFRVAAVNSAGTGPYSAVSPVVVLRAAPSAPLLVSARVGSGTTATLQWSPPASSGSGPVTGYVLQRSSDGGRTWAVFVAGATASRSVIISDLTAGSWAFRIAAVNVYGIGVYSTMTTAIMIGSASPLAPPTNIRTVFMPGGVYLLWTPPQAARNNPAATYVVEYSSDNGATWRSFTNRSPTKPYVTVTGLADGTRYLFRVATADSTGRGSFSQPVSATPGLA